MPYFVDKNSKNRPLPTLGKVRALAADGAIMIAQPPRVIPNLVCVVIVSLDEGQAVYVHDQQDFVGLAFNQDRPRVWMIYKHAKKLSGHPG